MWFSLCDIFYILYTTVHMSLIFFISMWEEMKCEHSLKQCKFIPHTTKFANFKVSFANQRNWSTFYFKNEHILAYVVVNLKLIAFLSNKLRIFVCFSKETTFLLNAIVFGISATNMSNGSETYIKTQPKLSHGYYENPWSTWKGLPNVIDLLRWKSTAREQDHPKVAFAHTTLHIFSFKILTFFSLIYLKNYRS